MDRLSSQWICQEINEEDKRSFLFVVNKEKVIMADLELLDQSCYGL
jgi:hypothetical protein